MDNFKNNNIDEFMNQLRQDIYTDFEYLKDDILNEIIHTFDDLTNYIVLIFKPVNNALSIIKESYKDFLTYTKSDTNNIKSININDWIYKSSWEKLVIQSVNKYKTPLLLHARKKLMNPDLAEDVVQDTFKKLSTCKHKEITKDVNNWLYRTCQNRAYDINKKNERINTIDQSIIESTHKDNIANPSKTALIKDDYKQLMNYLQNNLNSTQLKLLKLKFEKQMSSKEIAQALNLSENYVRKAICLTLISIKKSNYINKNKG